MSAQQGTVTIVYRGSEQICRPGDARRFMGFGGLVHGATGQRISPRPRSGMDEGRTFHHVLIGESLPMFQPWACRHLRGHHHRYHP
eukprot:8601562-Pyramimonas_sp.AAC.1